MASVEVVAALVMMMVAATKAAAGKVAMKVVVKAAAAVCTSRCHRDTQSPSVCSRPMTSQRSSRSWKSRRKYGELGSSTCAMRLKR